jgi:hypothetical protein
MVTAREFCIPTDGLLLVCLDDVAMHCPDLSGEAKTVFWSTRDDLVGIAR